MESERPIEKLLRAYATKRRERADFPSEPHPASRKLLQDEVARRLRQNAPQSSPGWWSAVAAWPRLVWGTGFGVVLVVAAGLVLLLPRGGKEPTLLVRNDQLLAPTRSLRPAPSSAPADKDMAGAVNRRQEAEKFA
ncbi:MAG TPA: hypothetical protein VJA21_33375, partial [Verrucomicrobiae bacterium]